MLASLRTSTGGGFPPPEATDRCRVRCTHGTVVYSFAALGAAFVREPGAARMAWMVMAHFTPPLSSQDAEMLGLVRVDKGRRTICSCGEKVCPRGALHARDFVTRHTPLALAKYHIGAPTSQLAHADFHLGARQHIGWRAPSPVLALQFNPLGFIGNVVVRLVFVLSWLSLSHSCRCVHCSMLVQYDLAYFQVLIHYANFQLEVDPRPVPVPAAAEQLDGQPQEQRQA